MRSAKSHINRLTSAAMDLENCSRFLQETNEQTYGSTVYEALLISAIICYVRPFSENEKKNSPYPSDPKVPEALLATLEVNESKLHGTLKELRNKAIAHAEWGFHPTGLTDDKIIQAMPFSIWKFFIDKNDISAFIDLAKKLLGIIQNAQANALREFF